MTVFTVIAGLGLLLVGLRSLIVALDEAVSSRLSPVLQRATATSLGAIGVGLLGSLFLQASSLVVIATMGLVQAGMVTLERALLVMLGAGLGSAAKAWFFMLPYDVLGPVLLGFGSLGLVTTRGFVRRRGLEVAVALGAIFFGWATARHGLEPWIAHPSIHAWLGGLRAESAEGVFLSVGVGAALASALQSSSTVVFVAISLADRGIIPPLAGAAMVLGANVGTTVTTVYVSLEYRRDARRLAVAQVIVRGISVTLAALFFGSFLGSVTTARSLLGLPDSPANLLASEHVALNALTLFAWAPFTGVLLRITAWLIPEAASRPGLLAGPVARILANDPELALREVSRERDDLLRELKVALDLAQTAMCQPQEPDDAARPELTQRVRAAQELLASIVTRSPTFVAMSEPLLLDLADVEEALHEANALLRRLVVEPPRFRRVRADVMRAATETLAAEREWLWRTILESDKTPPPPSAGSRMVALERTALQALYESGYPRSEGAVLLTRLLLHLRRTHSHVEAIARRDHRHEASQAPSAPEEGFSVLE
jgi:phosphate:Na+ symporter